MIISRPQTTDREEIHSLFRQTITHTFQINQIENPSDLDREITSQMNCLDDDYATGGESTTYLIAKEGDEIVGTIAIGPANADILEHLPEAANLPELKSIYVLPAYQGMGIGTRLVNAMISRLREEGKTAIVFDCGYKSAQEIWIYRFGQPTLELKNHWEDQSSYMIWKVPLEVVN